MDNWQRPSGRMATQAVSQSANRSRTRPCPPNPNPIPSLPGKQISADSFVWLLVWALRFAVDHSSIAAEKW